MAANVIDDGSVDIRTADSIRARANDLATRDDSHVSRATADIDDCRGVWLVSLDAASEGRRKTFLNHTHAPDVSVLGRTEQRASFHRRDIGEDTHQRAPAQV